jgi:nucleoside-diphosphate-sugar epimerase
MAKKSGSHVLVTGGSGFIGRRAVSPLLAGGPDGTVADLGASPNSAVRVLGCKPTFDLDTGLATVWPEFDPHRATEA